MAVYLETSLGDVVFDLYVQGAPVGAKNFIRLCKSGYYDEGACSIIRARLHTFNVGTAQAQVLKHVV